MSIAPSNESLLKNTSFFPGNKDNSLSRKGYCQADLLGQRLKCEKFTHIYCSDITKAKEVGYTGTR